MYFADPLKTHFRSVPESHFPEKEKVDAMFLPFLLLVNYSFLPQISGLSLPLPPKKLIGNMDREFIAERQKGLQAYLNFITQHHILSSCELVKKFLDTNNYSANYTGAYVENQLKSSLRQYNI